MKRYILILSLLSILLPLSSCKKFLEEQSQTDLIPRNIDDLNELLIGAAYTPAASGNISAQTLRMMDDDVVQDGFIAIGNTLNTSAYTWQPESAILPLSVAGSTLWTTRYPQILTCNLILQYAGKVTGTTVEIENVVGQAYLLRAYYYFLLVNYYGKPYADSESNPETDLGVPLMLDGNLSLVGKPRNTVAEVYRQILSDLEKGITLMERSGKNNNIYRISHIGGYLLASRVHLYMGNWQKAIDAATNVLNRQATLMDLTSWGTPNQTTKQIVGLTNVETIWGHDNTNIVEMGNDDRNFRLSEDLIAVFEPGDLRSSIYISNKRSIKRGIIPGTAKIGQAFRTSEAYLNRAEAYAQLNKLGQASNAQLALNDLNTLRKKRFTVASYQDLTNTGADDLLGKCAQERRRELFEEESHRWFDLRRLGMPAIKHLFYQSNTQTVRYTLEPRDPAYLLQIPIAVLNQNPKLIPNPAPAYRNGQ